MLLQLNAQDGVISEEEIGFLQFWGARKSRAEDPTLAEAPCAVLSTKVEGGQGVGQGTQVRQNRKAQNYPVTRHLHL